MHTIPSALALLGEEPGASPFRLHPDRPGTGWAVAAGGQVWVWAEGLRPLPGAGPSDPYVYEVWTASPDGTATCAGAAAPNPAGTLLAALPAPGTPAAVLICARARGQVDRPAAVVLAGRLYATGLAAPAAGAAQAPDPATAPGAGPAPDAPVTGAAAPPCDTGPAAAPWTAAPGTGAAPADAAPGHGTAPPPATAPPPSGTGQGEPATRPALDTNGPACRPEAYRPGGSGPESASGGPTRAPEPVAAAPVLPAAGAEPAPGVLAELEVPPLGDPPWVTNPEPDPLPADALDGSSGAAAESQDAAAPPPPAAPPAAPAPIPAAPAGPWAAPGDPDGPAPGVTPIGPTPGPGTATSLLLPPGCEPLASATVHLQGQGACPGATGAAQLQFAPGSVLITLRGLPRPEHLGQSQQTGRPYNVYRVWLQSSATREVRLLGPATRIWEHTYRLQIPEGVPLRRYDTILVTAEDRAAGHQPSGLLVLSGRYRWYQPQA